MPSKSFATRALRRWYGPLSILLVGVVWTALSLSLWPLKDPDGSYASSPYGLSTNLENKALDLLFQLRDVLRPALRTRGLNEPITIIEYEARALGEVKVKGKNRFTKIFTVDVPGAEPKSAGEIAIARLKYDKTQHTGSLI